MVPLEWDDALNTGINELDTQHKKMLLLLHELDRLRDTAPTHEQVYAGILDVMEFASVHFATEERYMTPHAANMKTYEQHVRQHKEFMESTLSLLARFRVEGKALSNEVYSLLNSWFVDHIKVMDIAMSKELRALGVL